MKKLLSVLILALVFVSFGFADALVVPRIVYEGICDTVFEPTNAKRAATGDSGRAAPGIIDSFRTNPAALADKRFGMSLPSVSFTMFNIAGIMQNCSEELSFLTQQLAHLIGGVAPLDEGGTSSFEDFNWTNMIVTVLDQFGTGNNKLAVVDASAAFEFGNFGIGVNAQAEINAIGRTSLVPVVNVGAITGLGFKVVDNDKVNVAVGFSVNPTYRLYSQYVGVSDITSVINASGDVGKDIADMFLTNKPVMGGFAVPVNLGVRVNLNDNRFRIAAVVNNINGKYYMKSYNGIVDFLQEFGYENGPVIVEQSDSFEINTPASVNFGISYIPFENEWLFKPVFNIDFVDMVDIFNDIKNDEFAASDLLLHFNAGIDLTLFRILNVRAGINRGYVSVGAGLTLIGLRLEATYGWQETGAAIGDRPNDFFTIRFNLGADR